MVGDVAGAAPGGLGLLGGTFDPPHVGHLLIAQTAMAELSLERVLFLPAGQPVHKGNQEVSAAHHRVTMARLAVAGNDAFVVDTTDVERPGPHTTVTLVPLLEEKVATRPLWLLIGGDSLRDLPSWVRPQELVTRIRLAVLPRPGATIDWPALEEAITGVRAAVHLLDGPTVALSSTRMRQWASAGRSLRYMTPDPVCAYIARTGLYESQ
ncbi:MAG: nicotinate (nicotinamide) nucleotide adenylyltransferase [Anaerolineae bacterium]|nr:nicotinate (nicotinamide) nucleotide adenylyltransferase [Anaerolineae bacterium]